MQLHLLHGPTWHSSLHYPRPFSSCLYSSPELSPRPVPPPHHPTLSLLLTATAEHWYLPWSLPRVGLSSACLLLALSRLRASVPSHPRYWSVCVPQLQNLESLRALLKGTEAELSMRVSEAARRQEDPLQRQRTLVEEERLRYLNDEELITQQLK